MAGPKSPTSSTGLASSTGTRAGAGAPFATVANGDNPELLTDREGRLWTRESGIGPGGLTTRLQASAAALAASFNVAAGAVRLEQASGFVNAAAGVTVYAQFYDKIAGPPAPGDVPKQSIPIVGPGTYAWGPGRWDFALGLVIAFSTTPLDYNSAGAIGFYNLTGWTP